MSKQILALFPSFGAGTVGGIETSAVLAWQAIEQIATLQNRDAYLLCYGKSQRRDSTSHYHASSKLAALVHTLNPRIKPETVFVWHLGLLKLMPALLAHRPRVVVFLHGIEAWRKQDWLTRQLFQKVDLFLSNSNYTWNRFLQFQPQLATKPYRSVPLGLGDLTQEFLPPPNARPSVLMLSRLSLQEDYKGHREVIRAWPDVLKHVPDAQLIIAGDGDLRPQLEQAVADAGLTHYIHFLGYVSEAEKKRLLLEARCFCMPSRNEGFGLVYLEAMRLGRPCLVSTEDAGREVVNPPEAGLAAEPDNHEELASAIVRLLTPGPEWDQWSAAAQERYNTYYTASHFQHRLISALNA